jgi:hypothetical protein
MELNPLREVEKPVEGICNCVLETGYLNPPHRKERSLSLPRNPQKRRERDLLRHRRGIKDKGKEPIQNKLDWISKVTKPIARPLVTPFVNITKTRFLVASFWRHSSGD